MTHFKSGRESQSGQTLALLLVLVCILILAALLLFDLQSVIRGKMKADIASQAGALAAANWQRESLNIIGELNLVKASSALLADIPPEVDPEETPRSAGEIQTLLEKIDASVRLTSEIQTRVAFIGPLIGYGAAEQAVKNNGISGSCVELNGVLDSYLRKISADSDMRYYEPVNGFRWRTPYMAMIRAIQGASELSVVPSGAFAGFSRVNPAWMGMESVYDAVNRENWCHPMLLRILRSADDGFWGEDWFRVDLTPSRFPGESEIYTLDCDWYSLQLGDDDVRLIRKLLDDRKMRYVAWPADLTHWCFYGSSWFTWGDDYTGPDLTLWQGPERDGGGPYYYLRSNLRESSKYGGPVAAAAVAMRMETAGRFAGTGDPEHPIREADETDLTVGNYSVARTLGSIGDDQPPTVMPLVMPVFGESVLIPGTMMRFTFMSGGYSPLERFLVWASTADSIFAPSEPPPAGTAGYLAALRKLADPRWRKRGWNPNYSDADARGVAMAMLTGGEWPGGEAPGWLQQPVVYKTLSPVSPADTLVEITNDAGGVEYHYNDRFIIRRTGGFVVNEGVFCRSGYGGGGASGVHTGPGHI